MLNEGIDLIFQISSNDIYFIAVDCKVLRSLENLKSQIMT